MGLLTTKPVAVLQAEAELAGEAPGGLRRVLGPVDLTLLGVGAIVGLGGVALTGYMASNVAGPAVSLAFLLAGLAASLAALCFAELAGALPSSGGPYAWAYAGLGELPAWLVAWSLLLEYVLGAATVAEGWSQHLLALAGEVRGLPPAQPDRALVDALAVALVVVLTGALLAGTRAAARVNAALAVAKLLALLAIVVGGLLAVDAANWRPFVPPPDSAGRFGWPGVWSATGAVFFAYIGFDTIAVAAAEARHPRRDVPRATLAALIGCAALYVLTALVVTGTRRFRPADQVDPVGAVVGALGGPPWAALAMRGALVVGLSGVVLVLLLAGGRVLFAMARDGVLPPALGRVHPRTGAPRAATLLAGGTAAVTVLAPVTHTGDVVTVGALVVFLAVCVSFLALRRRRPTLERPFRVPAGEVVAGLGAVVAALLLVVTGRGALPVFGAWLFGGLLLYFGYGQAHSRVRRVAAAAAAAD